jgi:ribulose-phosphate 3-epimerase
LMMMRPEIVIEQLWWLKEQWIDIQNIWTHIELWEENVTQMMHLTRSFGVQYGVVINPHTDVEILKELVHEVDYVLIMWVVPGFSGQSFIEEVLTKVDLLRERRPDIELHLDGWVNGKTIETIRPYNFDLVVSGSFVFGADDRKGAIEILRGK